MVGEGGGSVRVLSTRALIDEVLHGGSRTDAVVPASVPDTPLWTASLSPLSL